MKSRFETLAAHYEKLLLEEDQKEETADTTLPPDAALPPPVEPAAEEVPVDAPPPADDATPAPAPAPVSAPLTSEGEVTLIRLLKQAFIAKPDDTDAVAIEGLGEVTAANAKQQLNTISSLLNKYAASGE